MPGDGQPDFEALLKQFSEMGIDSETISDAKSFIENMQSSSTTANQNLITHSVLRDIARKIIATKGDLPIGVSDQDQLAQSLAIANTWLDTEILFPASTLPANSAWSKGTWLDESLSGWQSLIEPLATGMADALAKVVTNPDTSLPVELAGVSDNSPEQQAAMKQMVAKLLRSFMGTLIANQLGQGVGLLANSITSANDVAIPLLKPESGPHLIPQNIQEWSDGLGIEKTEVNLYLALREVAASRLFAKNTWLHTYLRDAITTYGKGITIDVDSITRQAEEAMSSGQIDINNPQSINIALNSGLFTPQQTPAQELALTKLEMALALIEVGLIMLSLQ